MFHFLNILIYRFAFLIPPGIRIKKWFIYLYVNVVSPYWQNYLFDFEVFVTPYVVCKKLVVLTISH